MDERHTYGNYLSLIRDITGMDQPPLVADEDVEELVVCPLDLMIDTLLPQQKRAVRLRYGLDSGRRMTMDEVGRVMHRTGSRIGQIVKKALQMMKSPARGAHFWLLYGIERRLVTSSDPIRAQKGLSDISEKPADDLSAAALSESAAHVMDNYRTYRTESADQTALDLYNAYHTGHDPYHEKVWREGRRGGGKE